MKSLKIIFAGTPVFASAHLQAIIESHHQVVAVYTQPDRPAGRGKKLSSSPVKTLALEHSLPVYQPSSLKSEQEQQKLASLNADIFVVVAYGLILPKAVLDTPKFGCINVHGSILPRWRGAAPIQRAIAAGDKTSGVTIMQMDVGLDTGDMLLKASCPIHETDNAANLHDRLIEQGKPALLEVLEGLSYQTIQPEKQNDNEASYAHKLTKQEASIDWKRSATEINRLVRAFNPWPVATSIMTDQTIKIWQTTLLEQNSTSTPGTIIKADKEGLDIACGQGVLRITHAQPPSTRAMSIKDLLNSRKAFFAVGKQFT